MSLLNASNTSTQANSNPATFVPFSIPRTSTKSLAGLSYRVRDLYLFCRENSQEIEGAPANVFYLDFSQKSPHLYLPLKNKSMRLLKIKITSLTSSENTFSGYELRFEIERPHKPHKGPYRIPSNIHMIPYGYFNGLEYETSYSRKKANTNIFENERWSSWEKKFSVKSKSYPTASKLYTDLIYPKISFTVDKLTSLQPLDKINILDLGGGSGKLAAKLLDDLADRIAKINLIDRNEVLVERATNLISKGYRQIIPNTIDITIKEFPPEEFTKSFDIIILCGVVAAQVLTRKESLSIVEKSFGMLRPGGYLIVTSLSTPWLRAKDYKKIAPECEVLNTAFPFQNARKCWNFHNFYVIQNKIHES